VTIIKPAPPVPTLNIGDLKPTDEGRLVVLNGQLTAADSFSIGFKFQLSDDSGQIALTLFENVYDGLNQPEQVRVGARVRVTGTVSVYRGALEIVPAASQRLEVLSPPVLPPVEQRALNTISKEDRGKLVRVIASVIRLDKESGEALIKDDTGMQVLRLKGAVAKRVVLKPNDRVEAIGKVRFSRGKQTIDVVLPTDIKVLR
jgi:RecJ-like exonuclease